MDEIQLKYKPQNYSISIVIFIHVFYYGNKKGNNLIKIYKRKLEDFMNTDGEINNDSIMDTDIDTDIIYDTTQDTTYHTDKPAEDINTDDSIFNINCTGLEFFKGLCKPNNTNKEEETEYIYHILEQIKEDKFKEIFNRTIEEDTYIIKKDNNITYQISTISSQYLTNLSTVSLEKCESILKEIYSIDQDEKLILLKLEHDVEKFKIPIIEYQLFTKDGKSLNLSYCDKIPEQVSIPVNISVSDEYIHDPNSDFYQDRCYPYTSEYGTDLPIYDRKKNFNEKFLSLCEKNCIYIGYNKTNKTANCECKTKNEFPKYTSEELDIKELLYQFIDFKKTSNIFVFTCPKVLFTSKGFKANSGSYYNIAIIAGSGIFAILFFLKGYDLFQKKIEDIINKKFPEDGVTRITQISDTENETKIPPVFDYQNPNTSDNNNDLNQPFYNDYEINNLDYEEAVEVDKRTFFESFISQIKINFLPIFTFFIKDDYNSTEIIICLFLFGLSLDFAVRALFFSDSTMHKIYEDKGKYNFLYQLPIIIYPALISYVITKLLKYFSLYEAKITKIVKDSTNINEINKEINKLILSLKRRFTAFFIIMMLFLLLFWYYTSSFCAVFKNTQIPLIKDTVINYGISLLATFIGILFTCSLRLGALKRKSKCLYKISDIIGNIIEKLMDLICC